MRVFLDITKIVGFRTNSTKGTFLLLLSQSRELYELSGLKKYPYGLKLRPRTWKINKELKW